MSGIEKFVDGKRALLLTYLALLRTSRDLWIQGYFEDVVN